MSNSAVLPTLRQYAKAKGLTRLSHSVQQGKESGFPCIFATNPQTAESKVLMLSKGLGKEVEVGDPVRPLWDHPVTTSDDGTRLYLGRPQYDEIE